MAARAAAAAAAAAASGNNGGSGGRLKRITNTDNVYTIHKTAEGEEKFRCKACHRCFNLRCTLLRHVRHQHQGRFVPHPCPECGQVFKRTDHLKVHLKKIHQIETASSRKASMEAVAVSAGAFAEAAESPASTASVSSNPGANENEEEEEEELEAQVE